MKFNIRKNLCYAGLVFIYLLQLVRQDYAESLIYTSAIMGAIFLTHLINNKYLSVLPGLIIFVALSFYNPDYSVLTIPPYLLICINKNVLFPNKNTKIAAAWLGAMPHVLFVFSVVLLGYSFLSMDAVRETNLMFVHSVLVYAGLIIFAVASGGKKIKSKTNRNETKRSYENQTEERLFYISCIIAFTATIVFVWSRVHEIDLNFRIIYLPWFLFVCSVIYNDELMVERIAQRVDGLLEKLSNNKEKK